MSKNGNYPQHFSSKLAFDIYILRTAIKSHEKYIEQIKREASLYDDMQANGYFAASKVLMLEFTKVEEELKCMQLRMKKIIGEPNERDQSEG